MKILLTGLPKTGKTTVLKKIINEVDSIFWVAASELADEAGSRHGFIAENSMGNKVVIADKSAIDSEVIIGSFKVDLSAINKVYSEPINDVLGNRHNGLIIVDEIGRMQNESLDFRLALQRIFYSTASVLASIRYGDEWTKDYTGRNNVMTLVLTETNRNTAAEMLHTCLDARAAYDSLLLRQQELVCSMAKDYFDNGQDIQFGKLFSNAIPYITESKVKKLTDGKFMVEGRHEEHDVAIISGIWHCNCDLFTGQGVYASNQGLCSHIMACQLSLA